VEAFEQFQDFSKLIDSLHLLEENDIWTYIWNFPTFSSQKVYAHLVGRRQVHPAYSWLWKSCSQNKMEGLFLVTYEGHDKYSKSVKKKAHGSG
jgi:hypothetical protein